MNYETEILDSESDDGTMVSNVKELEDTVVGHKIVGVLRTKSDTYWSQKVDTVTLVLDNGVKVELFDTDDCCAYTYLDSFLLNVQTVDHIITGVGTTDNYTKWHIFADMGDVLELNVQWSCGNPFYYGYGFDIKVVAPSD